MKTLLKLLAPYLAVAVFWVVWPHAWLAILTYHAQILLWNARPPGEWRWRLGRREALMALPALAAGPAVYVLLPLLARTDPSVWLETYRLSGPALGWMFPYFGLVHPVLEQVHWRRLRAGRAWVHPVFAGYHLIVLFSLLTVPWLLLVFGVLTATSWAWDRMSGQGRGLAGPILFHILADAGIILAVLARA